MSTGKVNDLTRTILKYMAEAGVTYLEAETCLRSCLKQIKGVSIVNLDAYLHAFEDVTQQGQG